MGYSLQVIQAFVAPVVVISANGLLCLALYNRLAAVIGRTRTINKERFDLLARLSAMPCDARECLEAAHLRQRVDILHELGHLLFHRARLVRDALVLLLLAVVCMIGCSLALGLSPLWELLDRAALALFVAGMAVMLLGILRAVQELWVALGPVVFEHDMLERTLHEQAGEAAHPKKT